MNTFKAILFVLSCFVFVFSLLHIVAGMVNSICNTLAKNGKLIDPNLPGLFAALSFTYIMSYLFIW